MFSRRAQPEDGLANTRDAADEVRDGRLQVHAEHQEGGRVHRENPDTERAGPVRVVDVTQGCEAAK